MQMSIKLETNVTTIENNLEIVNKIMIISNWNNDFHRYALISLLYLWHRFANFVQLTKTIDQIVDFNLKRFWSRTIATTTITNIIYWRIRIFTEIEINLSWIKV